MELLPRFALALAVWREARGETVIGKLLVAQTIENRVVDPRWPETYVGVIMQPLQFSAFNRGDPESLLFPSEHDTSWPDCVAAADFVIGSPGRVTVANHYHAVGVMPAWADATHIVAREDHHVFYFL